MLTDHEYQRIREYIERTTGSRLKEPPVRAIEVNAAYRWQPRVRIEVGREYAGLEPGSPAEVILAIFEGGVFYVCTRSRGAGTGAPYFFSREDVRRVGYA